MHAARLSAPPPVSDQEHDGIAVYLLSQPPLDIYAAALPMRRNAADRVV
jgi:hypothetical protein